MAENSWFTNSALLAILIGVLLNNYFDSNSQTPGLFVRVPAGSSPSSFTSSECKGGETIYAEGDTQFSVINPNGQWGWQIGPLSPSSSCIQTSLWAGAGQQYLKTPDRFAGTATICYSTNNTLNIFLQGALQQPVLCSVRIYVGYTDIITALGGTSPGQYTCLKSSKNDCAFDGPSSFLQFQNTGMTGSAAYIVIHAVYCTSACQSTCVPTTSTSFVPTTTTTTTTATTTSQVSTTVTSTATSTVTSVTTSATTETSVSLVPTTATTTVTEVTTTTADNFITETSQTTSTFVTTDVRTSTLTLSGTTSVVTSTISETITATEVRTTIINPCDDPYDERCVPATKTSIVTTTLPAMTTTATQTLIQTTVVPTTRTQTIVVNGNTTTVTQVSSTTLTTTSLVTTTATVCTTEIVKPTPTCIDIGLAAPFNAYTFEDYQGSSDVQGRLLVGGNANLADGFSVADQLKITPCTEATVIIGGALFGWKTGRNYFGNIVVGKNSTVGPVQDPQCFQEPVVDPNFFNISKSNWDIQNANGFMCTLKSNYKSLNVEYGTLTLTLSGNKPYEVVNIDNGNFFNGVVSFINPLVGYKKGSVLIFNIKGKNAGIANINMEALKDIPVIFNFCQAETLTINNVAVRGFVVAPYARVKDATGVVWGSIFVRSLSGSLQVNIGIPPICIYDSPPRYVYFAPLNVARAKTGDAQKSVPTLSILYSIWAAILAFFF